MKTGERESDARVIVDRIAYRAGRRFYPARLKKGRGADGGAVYTLEMPVGRRDVLVSDAPTLEEVLRKHADLVRLAMAARVLQAGPSSRRGAAERGKSAGFGLPESGGESA